MKGNLSLQERAKKFSWGKAWGYALINGGNTLGALFVSYLMYYATDSLFLAAGSISAILAFSRVFDGITDIIAGALIDRTNTKIGKARPYILVGFLYWASILLLFATPVHFSTTAKIVWIFVLYNLNGAVFNTLLGTALPILLKRSVVDENARIKTLTMSGLFVSIAAIVVSVALPMLIAKTNNNPAGWTMMAAAFAVFGCLALLVTFFTCKEYTDEELMELGIIKKGEKQQALKIRDYFVAIKENDQLLIYIIQYAAMMLAMGLFNGAGTYYYAVNLGNLGLMSVVSLVSLAIYPFYPVFPKIIEKVGAIKFTRITLLIGAIGFFARAFCGANIVLLCITSFIAGFLLLGNSLTEKETTIQCMDYVYMKKGIRAEAIYSSLTGFTYKVMMGISSAVMGLILQIAHYDGALDVQPDSALFSINLLFNILPAVIGVICFFGFKKIKVYEMNRQMREEMNAEEAE